jgi:SPP1 gp7 family putative phage head morphogenesis protein
MLSVATKKKTRPARKPQSKPKMKGHGLSYNAAVQKRYQADLQRLMAEMIKETETAVNQIYSTPAAEEYFALDASVASESKKRLDKLLKDLEEMVSGKADRIVDKMIVGTDKASQRTLGLSLKELSGGLNIKTDFHTAGTKEAIESSVNANVDLIKTMTGDYIGQVRGAVNRSIQGGGGLEELIPNVKNFLDEKNKQVLNKAKNVALDQTRKAFTAITKTRMEKIGVTKFEWVHSGAGREPRPYHKSKAEYPAGLNGNIFDINDPPIIDRKTGERGLPGDAINCKCFMRPIISFDEDVEESSFGEIKDVDLNKRLEEPAVQRWGKPVGLQKGNETGLTFETLDKMSTLDFHLRQAGHKGVSARTDFKGIFGLEKMIDDPKLFKKYPSLKSANVIFADFHTPKKRGLAVDGNIFLNSKLYAKDKLRIQGTLIHEVEHLIQKAEGMAVPDDLVVRGAKEKFMKDYASQREIQARAKQELFMNSRRGTA